VLYNNFGATHEIPLGGTRSVYSLNETAFVEKNYPINLIEPTKQIPIPKKATETKRVVVIWVVVIYALLLVFFIILAVGFAVSIHKAKQADQSKANHVLYDNLHPTDGAEDKDP